MAAEQKQEQVPDYINLPAPTAWPFVTAFGLTLLAAGVGAPHPGMVGRRLSPLPAWRGGVVSRRVAGGRARFGARAAVGATSPSNHIGTPSSATTPTRSRRPPCSYSGRDSSLLVGYQGRHCWRDCDGDCCLCVWCHCPPQHLVPD